MKKNLVLTLFCVLLFAVSAAAQAKVRVKFAAGASAATLKGSVTGYKYVDYVVGAKNGQTMTVKIRTKNEFLQFVVFDAAMENLAESYFDKSWSGALAADGNYTVRVLFPRSEARRKSASASFSIRIAVE